MKKSSGFEKFFKGKEKSGGAKKEAIRKEKREIRKEREEQIANAKRQKRAQNRASFNNEPPKYNLEPPTSRYQKRDAGQGPDNRNKPSFKLERKGSGNPERIARQEQSQRGKNNDRFSSAKDNRFDKKEPRFERPKKDWNTAGKEGRFDKSKENRFGGSKDVRGGNKDTRKNERRENPTRPTRDKKFGDDNKREKPVSIQRKETGLKLQPRPNSQPASIKPKATPAKPLTDQMPLNKYIAHSGVCSRRDAVDLIKGGKVKVNGELILEPGHKVALTDDVKIGGKKLNPVKDFVYILLNKPKDYITTTDDPQERKTVLDLLSGAPDTRIYPVGRLDRNTSGVLLLTNDGDLSQKLTHPSNEIKKVYAVTLDKPLTRHHFDEILKGVPLEDGPAHVDTLAYTDAKDHTQIGVELHTGRNRIVRRIFEHYGYDVKALDRVIFAGLTKKNVNRGKWRFLTEKEVRDLKFFKKGR